MAKKKKRKPQEQKFLSPEKYVKERMRKLEIGDCFFSDDLLEHKFGIVFVTRRHNGGRISVARYLVDMSCKGIVKSSFQLRLDSIEYAQFIEHFEETSGMYKVTYNEAHNMLYGAVDFAKEAGIEPQESWNLTQYFLEEDDERIPLMEFDFGVNGEHYLLANSMAEAKRLIPIMEKHLGKGNFKFTVDVGGHGAGGNGGHDKEKKTDDDAPPFANVEEIIDRMASWRENCTRVARLKQPYTYKHPEYPKELLVENQDILTLLTNSVKDMRLTDADIDNVLAHDHSSLKRDMENIILYYIGVDCMKQAEDYEGYPAIANALSFLAEVGDEDSLEVIFELLRQTFDLVDWELGDITADFLVPAIVKLGKDNLPRLMDFMLETGLDNLLKMWVVSAVMDIAVLYPDKAAEVHGWLSRLIERILADYPEIPYADSTVNAYIVSALVDTHDINLLPQIEKMYKLDIVDFQIEGDYSDVEKAFAFGGYQKRSCLLDIHERYKSLFVEKEDNPPTTQSPAGLRR